MVKATIAGATPKEIYTIVSCVLGVWILLGGLFGGTYQVSERIQLLAHKAALLSPSRYLAIECVEEETEREEDQGSPDAAVVAWVAETISQGREDRHDTTEA
jgi:hypothetical protein